MKMLLFYSVLAAASVLSARDCIASDPIPLRQKLRSVAHQIIHECYTNNNWDLFVMNADGSNARNLTSTPGEHELYPQVSPDGTRIAFVVDQGEGRDTVRSLFVMDADGKNRRQIADHAREPFWHPSGKIIAYLPQEYPKWNVVDYYTKGIVFHDLTTGKSEPHPNSEKLHHLYNPSFSPDGRWIVSTVHAGMGLSHGTLLIEAHGNKIINLQIPGCRPCFSPDGKQIAWGPGDHEIAVAPINLEAGEPKVGERRVRILDEKSKIYHVDWSPDSRFLSISRGPDGKGDITKPGTHASACEIVGVYAPGWNICVVSAERDGSLNLNGASEADLAVLTTNGLSNKESAWIRAKSNSRSK
jgi:Tol biopolymer transport system component